MSRAAFLMDRLMCRVGLHGKSFIPLLSGFACAVPAIMGTRVIENKRDRLATILVLPFMSCSARLPIYLLVIGTFFAASSVFVRGGILLGAYALGTITAFLMAFIFKRTLLKGPAPAFILEMPPYRVPQPRVVLMTVARRCGDFLKRAGTVIFAFSVIMWAATHYPKPAHFTQDYDAKIAQLQQQETAADVSKDAAAELEGRIADLQDQQQQEIMEHSAAGYVGKVIAPVFRPLGMDWKMSIGVTGAFFAREVIVSTMGIVYAVGDADETSVALQHAIRADYSPLVGIALIVFVIYCMQCLSTLAIVRRETGGWKWPAFMFGYMTLLAYVAALLVFQVWHALGF
jgi:ferrous iron transport protein B